MKKILSLICALALVLTVFSGTSIEKTSAATGVIVGGIYNEDEVGLYKTAGELAEAIDGDEAKLLCNNGKDDVISFKAETNGCLVFSTVCLNWKKDVADTKFSAFSDSSLAAPAMVGFSSTGKFTTISDKWANNSEYFIYPMKKGETLYLKCTSEYGGARFGVYAGFIPTSDMFTVEGAKKTEDGIVITVKSANKKTKIAVNASSDTVTPSAYRNNGSELFDTKGIPGTGSATVTVKKAEEISLCVIITENDSAYYTIGLTTVDVAKLLKSNTADKDTEKDGNKSTESNIKTPLSVLAGTNVVVGYASPSTEVSVKVGSTTYTAKSDKTGLYKVKTSKLKKGKSVSIWEGDNKKNAITTKVTTK